MEFAAGHDIEKGVVPTNRGPSADNSSDRDRKCASLDERSDGPRPPSSDSESRHWGINMDACGLEARGITRVTASEENVVEMTETIEDNKP